MGHLFTQNSDARKGGCEINLATVHPRVFSFIELHDLRTLTFIYFFISRLNIQNISKYHLLHYTHECVIFLKLGIYIYPDYITRLNSQIY